MSEYEESLSFIKGSPDDVFPSWLFTPVFNDFDDDYYEESFAETVIQLQAKRIRRKYNDFFQWQKAMETYNAYMQEMVNKWGSLSIIENSVEAETMPDFIPPKPMLKNNKRNREFLKTGRMPVLRIVELPVEDDDIIALARQLYPDQMGTDLSLDDRKATKAEKKVYERMKNSSERKERRQNMYRRVGSSHGTDFIVEYLNQAKSGVYNSSGIRKKNIFDDDEMSLVDKAKEMERILTTPQYILDEEMQTETTFVNGRMVKRREQEQAEIYKILYEEGFNVIKSMNLHMNKKSIKMIRSQIGATEPMTKKEMKKLKKRNKKDQARVQRRRDENSNLSNMLLRNKINESEMRDENGNITFRLQDLRDIYTD